MSGANQTSPERSEDLIMGERKIKKNKKLMQKRIFYIFLQKICLCQKKAVSLHSKSVNHFPLWVNNQKTLYYVSTIQV